MSVNVVDCSYIRWKAFVCVCILYVLRGVGSSHLVRISYSNLTILAKFPKMAINHGKHSQRTSVEDYFYSNGLLQTMVQFPK